MTGFSLTKKEFCYKIGLSIKELEGTSKEYGYEEFINNIEGEDKKDE